MKELRLKKGETIYAAPALVQRFFIMAHAGIPVTISFIEEVQTKHPDYFIELSEKQQKILDKKRAKLRQEELQRKINAQKRNMSFFEKLNQELGKPKPELV